VLRAVNPLYALDLLLNHPGGFWLLGAVFLCTTGADALYSDLGHCGKGNIRVGWTCVKACLLLNYAGQAAWLLKNAATPLGTTNPFYALMPEKFLPVGITIATLAAITASQAMISGSFTLVTEAMRLYFFPKVKVVYPSELKGQLYVPAISFLLFLCCCGVVLWFRESSNMEAAYGMAITITMLMTTTLMTNYLWQRGFNRVGLVLFALVFFSLEFCFMLANLSKFTHGGWVTWVIGGAIFTVMWFWSAGSQLKRSLTEYDDIREHLPLLGELSADETIPKFSTHLVYMTGANSSQQIEKKIAYSIFRKNPKRADVYWFLHVDVLDDPYTLEYRVTPLIPERAFRVDFRLGFRVEPRINLLFRTVIQDMAAAKEVDVTSRYPSLRKVGVPGDFRFVVLSKFLSYENVLPVYERTIMRGYFLLKRMSLKEEEGFGLDTSSVVKETVPLVINPAAQFKMHRLPLPPPKTSQAAVA
jgi:KUP system potassium uptake protein